MFSIMPAAERTPAAGFVFLELYYAYPAKANRVRIFQIDDPGAVDTVYIRNATTGTWQKIFETKGNSNISKNSSLAQ